MHRNGDEHLTTITPIDPAEARQLMNPFSLIKNSVLFIAFQTAWVWLAVISVMIYHPLDPFSAMVGTCVFMLACAWLVAQFTMIFIYPEWPINLHLSDKLRRRINDRSDRAKWVSDPDLRVVELVPRERWNKMAMETATDLLLIRIDSTGIQMEGDCDRYELPCASILGAELHSIRPSGWFTDTHMVIITARTNQGAVELPISYRDHRFGCLRNSRRRHQALKLTEQINSIATGATGPITSPLSVIQRPVMDRRNPYAAPASVQS